MEGTNEFCHDLIEERNNKIYVYNSKSEVIPGINPLVFHTMDDYKKHMAWKEKNGSSCPVLYIKRKYTTQNKLIPNIVYNTMRKNYEKPELSEKIDNIYDYINKVDIDNKLWFNI